MPPSPALYYYAGTALDGGGSNAVWATPSSATGQPDAAYATATLTGGQSTNNLNLSNFNFNLPANSVIDGILVDFDRYGSAAATQSLQIIKAGSLSGTVKNGNDGWPAAESFVTYGSSTDTWGASLIGSDINNSGFGVAISAYNTHGGGSASIDSVRISIYFHTPPVEVNKTYTYKTYNNGVYVGNLPNVTSEPAFSQDINTAGSQISVTCAVSADIAMLPNYPILDETGIAITDEAGNTITDEGTPPIVGHGISNQIIRNGNHVMIYEYGYWNPNGKVIFQGQIQRWEAGFGGSSGDQIKLLIYSDGRDMDNHLVRGNPYVYTADQTQNQQNGNGTITNTSSNKLDSFNYYGQTLTVGTGVTNIGAIALYISGTANITVTLYDGSGLQNQLATVTQYCNITNGPIVNQFNFSTHAQVIAGQQYFFTVTVASGQSCVIYYDSSNPYAGGQMYNANNGNYTPSAGSDLYFITYSSSGSTTATYSNLDPSTGILLPILQDYIAEGGVIQASSSSIQATGLSLTTGFNTNTVYEACQQVYTLSPTGFFYYVDLGSNTFYFKQSSTTADIILTKDYQIETMNLVGTIEQMINTVYFTGGQVSGSNIYTLDTDVKSISLYGQFLDRPTNNNVTNTAAAHAIGNAEVSRYKNEKFETTVTILAHKMDISTLKPGMVVGFNGYGSFVDFLLLQIVRIDTEPDRATLTLGIIPIRLHKAVEKVIRGYIGLNTVTNPTSPS